MQLIDFVVGDIVDIAQYILLLHKCTGNIEHKSTISELWLILNITSSHHGRQAHLLGIYLTRKELQEGLHAIESTTITTRYNLHRIVRHCEAVLLHGKRLVECESDIITLWSDLYNIVKRKILLRVAHDRSKLLDIAHKSGRRNDHECVVVFFERKGLRHNGYRRGCKCNCNKCNDSQKESFHISLVFKLFYKDRQKSGKLFYL